MENISISSSHRMLFSVNSLPMFLIGSTSEEIDAMKSIIDNGYMRIAARGTGGPRKGAPDKCVYDKDDDDDVDEYYHCEDCDRIFTEGSQLIKHMQVVHCVMDMDFGGDISALEKSIFYEVLMINAKKIPKRAENPTSRTGDPKKGDSAKFVDD